jgi:hypothetical protein
MSERLTDAERRALLSDAAGVLDPRKEADLEVVADLLADPSLWTEPDAGLEDRIVNAVSTAPTSASDHRASAVPPAGTARTRRRWVIAAVAAVAASVLVAVVLATSGPGGSGAEFSTRLTSTGLAPGARAHATVTRNRAGFRIQLDARGLRRLRDGAYYQAWLKNTRGGLVSIGTFSSSAGEIVLWSGVSPAEYRAITVTIEPDDDDPASSGSLVLTGMLRPTASGGR